MTDHLCRLKNYNRSSKRFLRVFAASREIATSKGFFNGLLIAAGFPLTLGR